MFVYYGQSLEPKLDPDSDQNRTDLKGQSHEIFDPRFFHQSIPLCPLIHLLKPIGIKFVFAQIFDFKFKLPVSKTFFCFEDNM
jgi:hypothetical protein